MESRPRSWEFHFMLPLQDFLLTDMLTCAVQCSDCNLLLFCRCKMAKG